MVTFNLRSTTKQCAIFTETSMQPDDNDIVYTQYSPDFLGLIRRIAEAVSGSDVSADGFMATLATFWDIFSVIAFLLSLLFIVGIIYSYIRIGQFSEIEAQKMADAEAAWRAKHGQEPANRRWAEVQEHVRSNTPGDWKLAIVEADIMLGEVLHEAGYGGLTIGDQLKSASASNFRSVQDAWDAHKIRNRIAHEGADFQLTQSMAKEAVYKYQRVFEEFGAI
tara:strand:- start:896 stop:1561 length:666 start_codon:yes stop_codon:yes gene_type:complete